MNFGHLELLLLNWLQQRRAFVLAGWFVLLQVQDWTKSDDAAKKIKPWKYEALMSFLLSDLIARE